MKNFWTKCLIISLWIFGIFSVLLIPKIQFKASDLRTIDVFVWGDYFDPKMIAQFEKDKNIRVKLHYYSSNEEIILKLKAHKGHGYDLVIPSDYAIQLLIKENLLQPIDYSKIDFMHKISPKLLNHSYDPDNQYSIPNMWEIYGISYDGNQIDRKKIQPTLAHLFDPNLIDYQLSMTPDPVEAITFASCYLYGIVDQLNKEQAEVIKKLLLDQKPHVEAYADYRAKYLMQTKNCPIAILRSSLLYQIGRENPQMGLILPKEATILSIESVAIPIGSKKQELVYEFIDFLYQDEVQASQLSICPLYPVFDSALKNTHEVEEYYIRYEEALKKDNYCFFRYLLKEQEIRDMWVEIKN
jgi:spermidine/putrescine transport system substrate-binding protein